jgi:hypothetical protein
MLTRTVVRFGLTGAVLAGVVAAGHAGAQAGEVKICDSRGNCVIGVVEPAPPGPGGPGGGDGGAGGSGADVCTYQGLRFRCHDAELGWFNPANGCYYLRKESQPAANDPAWEGHTPGDGAVYDHICYPDVVPGGRLTGVVAPIWLANPPPGYGGTIGAWQLAQAAIASMQLRGPGVSIAPDPAGAGLVGLPVWLWIEPTATTWGTVTRTAAVPGVSVTATAQARYIVWDMGDGRSVTCANPGTRYDPSYGGASSPTCGYVYSASSRDQPGGRYTVTATTTWQVDWAGGGTAGRQTLTLASTVTIRIDELQVVVR